MAWKLKVQAFVGATLFLSSVVYMMHLFGHSASGKEALVPGAESGDVDPPLGLRPDSTIVAEVSDPQDVNDGTAAPPERPDALADLVVLISVDGLRPDAIFPYARTIHRMREDGAWASNARTISRSSTLPSHASMVSGVDVDLHGLAFNSWRPERGHIQYPTIFSAAQEAGLTTGLFVGKRKLAHLLDPEDAAHFEVGGVFCSRVTRLAVPYLREAREGLVFVHFSDPDAAGHMHGWMSDKYIKAVRRADHCVEDVIEALDARGGLDRTLVVVTSDHGGHDHRHGTRLAPDRHIPFVMWGGPVREGKIRRNVFNTDTAATILHALGLAAPQDMQGEPILEGLRASL